MISGDKMKIYVVKEKDKYIKIGKILKLMVKSCLFTAFFILLSLFAFIAICWGDSFYNYSKGISKNPLFNTYVIITESMIPTINVNDAIVVKRVKDNTLSIGDIITFSSNDIYFKGLTVTHRVVGKQLGADGNYIYRTKGDNNSLEDTALVNSDNIYGKVVIKLPKIGYVQLFVSSPFGFVVSIIVPVLLVIVYEVWRIRRVIKTEYKKIEI